jgi:hypothetical protein
MRRHVGIKLFTKIIWNNLIVSNSKIPWYPKLLFQRENALASLSLYQTIKVISKLLRLPAIHCFKPWKRSIKSWFPNHGHGFPNHGHGMRTVRSKITSGVGNSRGNPREILRARNEVVHHVIWHFSPLRPTSTVKIVTIHRDHSQRSVVLQFQFASFATPNRKSSIKSATLGQSQPRWQRRSSPRFTGQK